MTVIGLADGPHEIADRDVAARVRERRVRVIADPGWRPLLSGEVEELFGVTPVPLHDAGSGAANVAAARPRDGDGDGFVYDGTPRQRPWNPVTDMAYPDGVIPEKAKKVVQRPRRTPFTPTDRGGELGAGAKAADEKPPKPELSRTIDETKVLDYVEETVPGLGDIKVLVKGSDVSWDPTNRRWVEQHNLVISAKYREHNLVVDYYASDAFKAGRTVKVSWLARRANLDPSDPSDLSGGDDSTAGPPDVPPVVGYAFWEAAQAIDEALLGDVPPSPGTLAAEDMAPDSASWWKKILQDGPLGWTDITSESPMSVDDRLAIMRYRESVTRYGDLLREGEEPQDALRQVAALSFDLDPDSMPRDWRDVIEGRGYLSANLRALQGEPGFGEPDPDAIRFLQILREDFLAKTEQVPWRIHVDPDVPPMTGVRLYRASDNPDPWGGNDPTRFSSDAPRLPSSGVTSWAFMSGDDAKRQLPSYGSIVHGVDVPFDRVIGRFGAVKGELLVANDPELVRKIDEFNTGPARDRALDVLATLPDDPFAAPELRLSASERDGLNASLDYWVTTASMAPMVKRRFPELSDDDARKIALLGGVEEGDSSPWGLVPEWLSGVPWPRLRGWAVDRLVEDRGQSPTEGLRGGDLHLRRLRRGVKALHPSGDPGRGFVSTRLPEDLSAAAGETLERLVADISLPSAKQVDTELLDVDRRNLRALTDAGRTLLADLRQQQRAILAKATSVPAVDIGDLDARREGLQKAEQAYTEAVAEAVELQQAHLLDWLDIADAAPVDYAWPENGERTDTWPVGPITWAEPSNLIEVKGPRFTDSRGEGYHFEPIYGGRAGDVSGFRLHKDEVEFVDGDEARTLRNVPVQGAKPITAETLNHDDIASIRLGNLAHAVERARAADASRRLVGSQLSELEDLVGAYGWDDPVAGRSPSIGEAMESERSVIRQLARGTAGEFLREGSRGGAGWWPEDGSAEDKTLRRVLQGLVDATVMAGAPATNERHRFQPQVVVPLEPVPGFDFKWAKAELVITNPEGQIARRTPYHLNVWLDDPTGAGDPDIVGNFDPPNGSRYVPEILRRFKGIEARYKRATEVADLQTHVATREWAAETLGATEQPSVKEVTDDDAQRIARLYEHITPFIPDSLKWAAGPVQVKAQKPLEDRSDYTAAERDGTPIHRIRMTRTAEDSVYLHEYGHHVERIGVIGRAVWAFYQHRTKGEDLEPLGDGYKPTEFTRPDEFFNRYAGKDYGKLTSRSEATPSELFTMGLEGVFYGKRGPNGDPIDDEYAAFILGTLLHSGERAKRYDRPGNTPGSTSGPAAPLAAEVVEDVYKLVNSRVRPEPVAIPNTPNIYPASQVERSEVVALVKNPNASEEVAGANEAIREAVRHTQRSLRAAGVETVTLYRGASPTDDPFRRQPGASGVTSWTTNPAKAWTYAEDAFVVYRAEVPVENLLSYDVIGLAATASTSQARPLTGQEVLVVADPSVVEALAAEPVAPEGGVDLLDLLGVNRVTPATMEGNGTAGPAPAV